MDKYILDENDNPVKEPDSIKWAQSFGKPGGRILKQEDIDGVKVSTVFLGIDYRYGEGPPLLWETMIFGGEHDQYQERHSSKKDAIDGHNHAVGLVKGKE